MSDELVADFTMDYPSGATVHAALRRPTRGSSITVLFGPSGCGKTTVLRCLAGLQTPQAGMISFASQTWLDTSRGIALPPQGRNAGYVSQDSALFPHLTAAKNIGYSLTHLSHAQRRETVIQAVTRFKLDGLAERLPRQLSGGQQQRVALARAIVRRPRLLLLDEPLSALDTVARDELRRDLRNMLSDAAIPVVLVTHDRVEAISLADHVVVMDEGRILQAGNVHEVFSRPADVAVARVVGIETVQPGRVIRVVDGLATVEIGPVSVLAVAGEAAVGNVFVCIRAEEVVLQKNLAPSSARNQLTGKVTSISLEGAMVRVFLDCGMPLSALVTRVACEELDLHVNDTLIAMLKAPAIHLIPTR